MTIFESMLKKLVAISLIISFGISLVRFTIPYASYYANYDYIANHLCVNRNHPEIHCNGKCQLKKMIKKEVHHHNHSKAAHTSDHNQRIDFFIVDKDYCSLEVALKKIGFHQISENLTSLYFSEPLSPPPQFC